MDTLFFIASKIVGFGLRGETWIALLLLLGFWAQYRGNRRSGRAFLGAGFALLVAIAALPLGDMMLRPFETVHPPKPKLMRVDGIIILGGAEQAGLAQHWGLPMVNEAGERFIAGAALAHQYPHARVVFSGGSGALRDLGRKVPLQSGMAADLLTSLGIPLSRIELEGTSRNTAENARNSFDMLQPKDTETWVLVTSAFHMPRAVRSFHAAGWTKVVPWPVDFRSRDRRAGINWDLARNLKMFNTATKETIGLIAYNLSDR
ncbi:YdcF family protein [Thalassovita sp.]|jgi:uncharacterized SAM-binding protein YcdF (DUF218 family)|uniref:YdcF family protein n=1 Tax=Thalassovita sp. TaxID=1979401 RepID=UPI003B59D2B4